MKTNLKTGSEAFHQNSSPLSFDLSSFWRWAYSDILSNATRGKLAEFIVASALGIAHEPRSEWMPYDLTTKDGFRIEVKSAAYLQSWHQDKLSKISFNISPARIWDPATNRLGNKKERPSDVYVFCLLSHKNKETVDPLDLSQWRFFILGTRTLNQRCPTQKTITLNSLLKLEPLEVRYEDMRAIIGKIKR